MKAPYAEKVLISPMTSGTTRPQPPRDAQDRADAVRLPRWGPKATILEAVETAGVFKTLAQALRDSHLDDLLNERGPFTLFAPTDEAFAKMPSADLRALLANPPRLRALLSSHIVAVKVRAPRERVPNTATSVDGRTLTMTVRQGYYKVNEAQIVKPNLRASNGIIHAIDALLLPV
jgi:uncharacterized surface protein with fasciclin (FAS1) repeats